MAIDKISEDNLDALVQLVLKLWPECHFEEEYENYRRVLHSEKDMAWLFKAGDRHVAFILVALRTDYVEGTSSTPVGYVEGIYVLPEFRRHGVARELMRVAEDWCRHKGCIEIASDTELGNEISQKFHKKHGFREVNRIVCFTKQL